VLQTSLPLSNAVLPDNVEQGLLRAIDNGEFKRLKHWLGHERVISVVSQSKEKLLVLLNAVAREKYDDVRKTVDEVKVNSIRRYLISNIVEMKPLDKCCASTYASLTLLSALNMTYPLCSYVSTWISRRRKT